MADVIDASPLVDGFGRAIRYLRVSVTDRCDLRCVYCMSEDMRFVPRDEVLSLEELDRVCSAFVALGVRKLRLTGGEPLVRRGAMTLVRALSSDSAIVQRMARALLVEGPDGVVDGAIEVFGVAEGLMSEVVAFQIAPDFLDVV